MNELQQTLNILRNGGLILYPTDTVWGIGCDATDKTAVEKIYALKQRPDTKSLIVLVDSVSMIEQYVRQVPPMAYDLIELSNTPLTIIYPNATGIAANAIADDGSIAIRVVQNTFCQELIRLFGRPVISTSANISANPTPKNFGEISRAVKEGVDFVVDETMDKGSTQKPSSIIKLGLQGEIEIIRK